MKFKVMKKKEDEILFDFYTVPNSKNENEKLFCVRPVVQRTITTDDLADRIEKECTLTRADVKAVIEASFGVSRSTAQRIIKDLLKSGKIINRNTKKNPVYIKGPNF